MRRLTRSQAILTVLLVSMVALVALTGVTGAALAASEPPGIPASPVPTRDDVIDEVRPGTPAWEQALAEAEQPDLRDVLEPRPLAAIGGTIWFLLVARHRWRSRPRIKSH